MKLINQLISICLLELFCGSMLILLDPVTRFFDIAGGFFLGYALCCATWALYLGLGIK